VCLFEFLDNRERLFNVFVAVVTNLSQKAKEMMLCVESVLVVGDSRRILAELKWIVIVFVTSEPEQELNSRGAQ